MGQKKTFLKVGISACLLGEPVRYDGAHKRHDALLSEIGDRFELLPICPEVAIGLGVPRPPIHLLETSAGIRAVGVEDASLDVTAAMTHYSQQCLATLSDLCGYVFKCRSPSCGVSDVDIYSPAGNVIKQGTGLFAEALIEAYPDLPVADEITLATADGLAAFIHRVEVYGGFKQT